METLSIVWPAFLAGLIVLATHVPLGRQVLARGIIFIDIAVAQVAAIGAIALHALGYDTNAWIEQGGALVAALAGGVLLSWTDRRWPILQEALIGVLYVLAASGALILLSHDPHGGEHLNDLLAGQILWTDPHDLPLMAFLSAAILLLWRLLNGAAGRLGFYFLFALAVTLSVQLVGVFLVFASLILPALATRHLQGRSGLLVAGGIGAGGYALGLTVSALIDWPSGATIVWSLALVAGFTDVAMRLKR